MTVIKGFFFDLDGTLVDTHEANFYAYHEAIKSVKGIDMNAQLRDRIKLGESSHTFLPELINDLTENELDTINAEKKKYYPKHLDKSSLNESLVGFLKKLSEHYTTVLVTTAKRTNAESVLKFHELDSFFTYSIYGDDVQVMKPHPEAYLKALEITGLKASEVIAFEDSNKGIEAATAAGINTIHIKDFI